MSTERVQPEPTSTSAAHAQFGGRVAPLPDRIERLGLLAQTLMLNPSWDDLTRLLVLRIFDGWRCSGAVVFTPVANGSLSLLASYGYPESQLQSLATVPLEFDAPLPRAMSTDEVVWFPEVIDVVEATGRVPISLADSSGLILAPLTRLGIPLMVVALSFRDELPTNPASGPFVAAVKSLLELHLGQSEYRRSDGRAPVPGDSADDRPSQLFDVSLSARQLQVLTLLAQAKTNRSIALDLGYSESTIRQETLRLYRALNVNSRSDAVSAAASIGLISPGQ
ncbi:MAG: hypothetical protein F2840_14735 [Actinobacteria bacterium]|uniref:Unannotated protein n=1 Tax=freshwater metagenome TaxID=449393 RepID=A0A6J7LGT5_9ZZZZ|nr:hypothetical protein [Actinomycetota bacterium]